MFALELRKFLPIDSPNRGYKRDLIMQDYIEDLLDVVYDESDDEVAEDYSEL